MKIAFKFFVVINMFCMPVLAVNIQKAIEAEIKNNKDCQSLGDFYWEIGNKNEKLYSGKRGTEYSAETKVRLASASKWLFGAYALEKLGEKITDEQKNFLQMRSGYTNMAMGTCWTQNAKSVKDCFLAQPRVGRLFRKSTATQSAEYKGKFYYNGAHAQALAMKAELGLAEAKTEDLAKLIAGVLKLTNLDYESPQLAGGAVTNAQTYAAFLQNLMSGKYQMSKTIQTEPGVCASHACNVKDFAESPVPKDFNWWYGNHYWIEKTQQNKVEAYSSPGLFGFYPWITADKKYYGLISRKGRAMERGIKSVYCGVAIRKVFLKLQ